MGKEALVTFPRIAWIALIVVAAAGTVQAGWSRGRARPQPWCGIPARDYQYRPRSEADTALSGTAIPPTRPADDSLNLIARHVKVYKLDRPLKVGHCGVSAVAIELRDDGQWTLSLRADQNPPVQPPATLGGLPTQLQTSHLLRSEFQVGVRCYGAAEVVAGPQADQGPGKPVLCELRPEGFWVQRGQPRHLRFEGGSECVRQFFALIDRVEVEFYYYK
jgi:hypothetical protein